MRRPFLFTVPGLISASLFALILASALLVVTTELEAQTVTCSTSGLTAKQTQLVADFIASVNAARTEAGQPTFADFNAFCADTMRNAVVGYAQTQRNVEIAKVTAAALTNGDGTAPNGMCTAAGLSIGCKREQVACVALTGNAACN